MDAATLLDDSEVYAFLHSASRCARSWSWTAAAAALLWTRSTPYLAPPVCVTVRAGGAERSRRLRHAGQ